MQSRWFATVEGHQEECHSVACTRSKARSWQLGQPLPLAACLLLTMGFMAMGSSSWIQVVGTSSQVYHFILSSKTLWWRSPWQPNLLLALPPCKQYLMRRRSHNLPAGTVGTARPAPAGLGASLPGYVKSDLLFPLIFRTPLP